MRRAVIITSFDSYSYKVRIKYLEQILIEQGYDCIILAADFEHRSKLKYEEKRKGLELVHTPQYKRNLSFKRIYSHYMFAKNVFKKTEGIEPDLVYVNTPPNFLFLYGNKYKKKHPYTKMIYDIWDMWPESLPINGIKRKIVQPLLQIWALLRNKFIKSADGIVCECDLFKDHLVEYCGNKLMQTIYLCKENYINGELLKRSDNNELAFAYVGSVNNIIDIDLIVGFLDEVNQNKKVNLHIIGGGENLARLIQMCENRNIAYMNHGNVFDENKKKNILEECVFGLNVMKDSVFVGATMKSLEYFHAGLVLINTIPGDTNSMVDKYYCGFNISKDNVKEIADNVVNLSYEDIFTMQNNSRKVYERHFATAVMKNNLKTFINKII